MATVNELLAQVDAVSGVFASLGRSEPAGGDLTVVYMHIIGPVVTNAGPYDKKKLLVKNLGTGTEQAIFWGESPEVLKPDTSPTPVGTDQEILQAIAAVFDMTGKKVIDKTIVHQEYGAVARARIATIATNTFKDYSWVVIDNAGNLEVYSQEV